MADPVFVGFGIVAGIAAGGFIYSLYDPTEANSIKLRTGEGEFEPVIETPRKKHGLIVLGDTGKHRGAYATNSSNQVYKTLIAKGFDKEDLYVLEGKKKSTERFDCNTLPSSKKHLREVLSHLYSKITPEDTFFMYVLTHGSTTGIMPSTGQSTFSLDKGTVREEELEELLSDLHPDHSITFFNSCHSGGFAQRLGKDRNVAISTSRKDKVTPGYVGKEIEKKYGLHASPFTLFFYSALNNQMPNGETLSLENLSIEEAFDYAATSADSSEFTMGNFFKNTPHLVYGKINPKDIKL